METEGRQREKGWKVQQQACTAREEEPEEEPRETTRREEKRWRQEGDRFTFKGGSGFLLMR